MADEEEFKEWKWNDDKAKKFLEELRVSKIMDWEEDSVEKLSGFIHELLQKLQIIAFVEGQNLAKEARKKIGVIPQSTEEAFVQQFYNRRIMEYSGFLLLFSIENYDDIRKLAMELKNNE